MQALILRYLSRLRFPWLLAVTGVLLVADLVLPDPIPIVDELLLAMLGILFATWRKRRDPERVEPQGSSD